MVTQHRHNIPEQNKAYRRGIVLGLTMAEVGILIIFVLLLLLGLTDSLRKKQERDMDGHKLITTDRVRTLEEAESFMTQLRGTLHAANNANVEEISRLIRALQEIATTQKGRTALQEVSAAITELNRIKDQIKKDGGSDALASEVEQQSYRIANQEGQLQRYESQLKEAGLGKGERPCWVKADGTIEYLYDVVLSSNGIKMREYKYDHRERECALLPKPAVDPNELLSPTEFLQRTQPLYNHSLAQNCRFFVVVYDATGPTEKELYKQLLRTVEGHFYKRLDRGTAPF
ncbi:MAG: hypothetical protein AABY87_12990 [bacterium]|mgnify:CR=1 FL=1